MTVIEIRAMESIVSIARTLSDILEELRHINQHLSGCDSSESDLDGSASVSGGNNKSGE